MTEREKKLREYGYSYGDLLVMTREAYEDIFSYGAQAKDWPVGTLLRLLNISSDFEHPDAPVSAYVESILGFAVGGISLECLKGMRQEFVNFEQVGK